MDHHRNQFYHHTLSKEKKSDGKASKQTDKSQTGHDLFDENRKRPTHSGNSSVPQTESTPNEAATPQFSKKRKIRMGPQECLEYSSTSKGASALTNPQLVPKSSKDVNEKLQPIQRGRSHGSCFISAHEQSQVIKKESHHLAHSSQREYVSPSKGAGMKAANQGSIYDSSGFALIGSPTKKNERTGSQFALNSPKSLSGKSGQALNKSISNNWRKPTNVWKKTSNSSSPTQSPHAQQTFISQPDVKVFPLQSNTVNDKQFSQGGQTFSQSSSGSQCNRSNTQFTVSPNKWKKKSGSASVSSPVKGIDAPYLRSPTSKMQLSHQSSQKFFQHATQQQHQYRKPNISQAVVSSADNGVRKLSVSPPSQFHPVKQIVGGSVPNQSTQTAKKGNASPRKQTLVTDFYTKTPPKETGSDCNVSADRGMNTSVKRDLSQTWGTNLVKSPVKHSNQKLQGEAVHLKVRTTTNDNTTNSPWKMEPGESLKSQDEEIDRPEPSSSQTSSTGSCNLTSLSIQPQGETETQVDSDSLMEADTLPWSQSSTFSQTTNAGEEPEDDCIEDLLKDYEIDEKGHLRLSQSSSGHSENRDESNSGEKPDSKDFDDDSSDESQSLLRSLHENDENESTETLLEPNEAKTNRAQSKKGESFGVKDQSVCTSASQANFSSKKELLSKGASALNDNSASVLKHTGHHTEDVFASSSGSVNKNGLGNRSCTVQESSNSPQLSSESGKSSSPPAVEVNYGDMPDDEEFPEELLAQIEANEANDENESTETLLEPKETKTNRAQSKKGESFGVKDQSVCTSASQANFSSKKELLNKGASASNDNSASVLKHTCHHTEDVFASSSGSVNKNGLGNRSCTVQESSNSPELSSELGKSSSPPAVEVNYGDMPDDEEFPEELLAQIEAGNLVDDVSLKDRTFGLVGNGSDEEIEDEKIDFFSTLPVELIENIFCRIPIFDLLLSCSIVCHQWANIISSDSFIPWKKSYNRCKAGHGSWSSPLKNSEKESCLLDVIRFLSTVSRKPGESTVADLQRHSNYEFAKDLIAENLPDLIKDGSPHPWSAVAALVVVAETVDDVREIFRCLLHPTSRNTPTTVTEVMYCIATLLLSLQKQHNLCRRLHFRVFYALFLYENDTKPSRVQLKEDSLTGQQRKTNHHRVSGKFPLTHEQLRIVNHKLNCEKNEVIKVVAFAGTGKTTTLIKFAEANIYHHLLYVAFNKSVQVEACKVFPGNTECRTSHSLAYEKLKYKYGKKLTFDLKPHMINDLIPERPKGEKSPLQWALYAKLVGESIKSFMASADEFITTKHVPVQYSTASAFHRPLTHHDRMLLLKDAEYLWERMIDEKDYEAKITHDGYFKVYQLSKPVITDAQCLLIDEAQDLTPAQQDVLLSQPLPKILVGDPHQQIYSFRGATNAMDAIQADKVYHLTQSFRFGSEIAYMANCVLDVYKQMTTHTIVGKEEEGTLCGEVIGQKAIICRGNTTVFSQAVKLCDMEGQENLRLGFTGFGEGKYCKSGFNFEKLMDIYKMSAGASGRSLQNPLFKKMQTFGNLEAYAVNAEDVELLALISIVKLYNHRIPELIRKIKSKTAKELQFATVVLTTAHKSKGLEFDTVQLTDDFKMFGPRIIMGEEGMDVTDDFNIPEDEKNLIYVAVTRTKKSLRLNEGLRKCLGKASEQFKFPIPTKQFLECEHNMEERRCLDCGKPITEMKRVTMSKVWSVKLVSSPQHQNHPTNSGGFVCSGCSYYHLPGFEKFFLGDKNAPQTDIIT